MLRESVRALLKLNGISPPHPQAPPVQGKVVKIAHIKEFIMGPSLFALLRLARLASGRE